MIDVPDGLLYLGEEIDPTSHERNGRPVLLPSKDLTTHALIVGMTGSGKTGLGIDLVEEALLAGIPTLILDPKGDLANLLLTFPDLDAAAFEPWVEAGDPAEVARQWKEGLASWGIEPARIKALRDSATYRIYTPGSTAGTPLNVVGSLAPPPAGTDDELVHDEIEGFVSGLLNLVGVDADPLSSREFILLSNLIAKAWTDGQALDLATLVGQVQQPPLRKLGVFELDSFYPATDRKALAMKLNGLLASPSFAPWAEGPPIDMATLLQGDEGRPACAIVELAHLSDEERQFAVALILSKLVTWMRTQPGTSELRLLVYFDEVMGFVPPTAAPPAKKPILTILKQARAFGIGLVLATQNPVDVDYKGLSNAGTWMIGRLQTEQDKARLLDGLKAAAGGVDVQAVGATISGLGKREFVLRRASQASPAVFSSRWAMSYLRGPLTRDQIRLLAAGPEEAPNRSPTAEPAVVPATAAPDESTVMPAVADGVPVRWLDGGAGWITSVGGQPGSARLAPAIVARAELLYDDRAAGIRHTEEWEAVLFPLEPAIDPSTAQAVDYDERDFVGAAPTGVRYVLTDAPISTTTYFTGVRRALVDSLYRGRTIDVLRNRELRLFSRPGESKEDFARRCDQAADAGADSAAAALADKYQSRLARVQQQLSAARDRVEEAQAARASQRTEDVVSDAGSLLGSLLGGRRSARSIARSIGKAVSSGSRDAQAARRVETAEHRAAEKQGDLAELERDLADDLQGIAATWDAKAASVESLSIGLEKSDVAVADLALVWIPVP